MKQLRWVTGSALLGATLVFGFTNVSIYAEKAINKPVSQPNAVYKEECGACHVAYPAGFLPEKSWNKILANLDKHFDENAEVDNETAQQLKQYFAKHSMRKTLFNRLLRNFPTKSTPTRITKLPYFTRKHREISETWVKNNPKIGSFSQCDKCHRGASRGDFEEDDVRIPGL